MPTTQYRQVADRLPPDLYHVLAQQLMALIQQAALMRSLVPYRMVFGQNRQQDLIEYLQSKLSPEQVEQIVEQARIDLSPPVIEGTPGQGY